MLDNVIDLSSFPLPAQAREARGARRVGLGMTALADSLIMLGLHYADARAREVAAEAMRRICHAAYRASVALAREKGAFPYLDRGAYLEGVFIRTLPADIRDGIARDGIRNSHLTAIAPTGTVSLLADNVSSGIEPVFQAEYARQVRGADGVCSRQALCDYAVARWRSQPRDADLPGAFVTARELPPADHLAMQAALQPFVDSAISKTVNVPADYPYEAFRSLYLDAYRAGLKGCTTYRPNPLRGTILDLGEGGEPESLCCSLDRETGG
jgi:ribonucleoside-diphosphate reductase alpha chain